MKFTIPGRLPNLNDAIDAARRGKYIEASFRKKNERMIAWYIKKDLRKWKPKEPVILHYTFVEQDRRRDKDNVAGYAMKLIQDSLVRAGVLGGDGWNYIEGFDFTFAVDKKNPRIEVEIEEVKE